MNINPTVSEWLNLIARWVHVFAGIMWVGTTYYFTWLDARLTEEEMRILPAQRKMIEAIKAGKQPDQALAAQAKLRSKQNTFMAVPVVFLMISNHYGGNTTGGYDWIHLAVLVPLGWIAAKFLRRA